jgi:hypothetical protein
VRKKIFMSNAEIQSRVQAFTNDLVSIVKKSALHAVQEALGGTTVTKGAKRSKPVSKASAPRISVAKKTTGTKRGPGEKRDPKLLGNLVEKLATYIKAKPGQRIEEINKGLGLSTRELNLPVKKLLAAKRISTKGTKRSTTYFPV